MQSAPTHIASGQFTEAVAYLLRETFVGSPEGHASAYLDRGVGFLATLKDISAEKASEYAGGTTIAAHTEHAKFYLDRLCEYIEGSTASVNWEDSWLIETVDEDEWDALRSAALASYESSLKCLAGLSNWDALRVGMAMGLVAHSAYHLGAIRQMAKLLKK